jgi:hypothetical protein
LEATHTQEPYRTFHPKPLLHHHPIAGPTLKPHFIQQKFQNLFKDEKFAHLKEV